MSYVNKLKQGDLVCDIEDARIPSPEEVTGKVLKDDFTWGEGGGGSQREELVLDFGYTEPTVSELVAALEEHNFVNGNPLGIVMYGGGTQLHTYSFEINPNKHSPSNFDVTYFRITSDLFASCQVTGVSPDSNISTGQGSWFGGTEKRLEGINVPEIKPWTTSQTQSFKYQDGEYKWVKDTQLYKHNLIIKEASDKYLYLDFISSDSTPLTSSTLYNKLNWNNFDSGTGASRNGDFVICSYNVSFGAQGYEVINMTKIDSASLTYLDVRATVYKISDKTVDGFGGIFYYSDFVSDTVTTF